MFSAYVKILRAPALKLTPPSIIRLAPVMNWVSLETRNTTPLAISSG